MIQISACRPTLTNTREGTGKGSGPGIIKLRYVSLDTQAYT